MLAPLAEGDVEITAVKITSRPYVDLTLEIMSSFGISVDARAESFKIAGGQHYRPRTYHVEPDASAATHFFAAAAGTGGRGRVEGLSAASLQADVRFVEVLERMCCSGGRGPRVDPVRAHPDLAGVGRDLGA